MRLSQKHFTFLFFLFALSFGLHAQPTFKYTQQPIEIESTPKDFRHLTVNEGFSRSAVLDILQDQNGIMWFGTWDGLYTFDGYKLKMICQPKHPRTGESQVISSIAESNQQEIWMNTPNGIYIWNDKYKTIEQFSAVTANNDTIRKKITFLQKDNDYFWFGTDQSKVYAYNALSKQIDAELQLGKTHKIYPTSMYIDDENHRWLCTINNGIFKIDDHIDAQHVGVTRDTLFNDFNSETVYCIFKDTQKHHWVATSKEIFLIKNTLYPTAERAFMFEYPENLSKKEIKIKKFAENGKYVFTSSNLGLFVFDKQKEKAHWVVKGKDVKNGLNDNNITKVHVDNEGGLWLSTFNGGINYLSPTSENFSAYNNINTLLEGHVISGIAETDDHNLWISTEDGGYSFWDRKTGNVLNYNNAKQGYMAPTVNNIQSIFWDNGKLYLGTYNKGLDIIDLATRTKKNYNALNTKPASRLSSVYAFHKKEQGQILIGAINGLYLFEESTKTFRKLPRSYGKVNCILQDQDKEIWVGSSAGIFHYSRNLIFKEHLQHAKADTTTLTSNNVTALGSFGSMLYIGTNGKGLWTLQKNEKVYKRIAEQPLGDATIYKLIFDNDNLWISTNKGLYNYNITTQESKAYTAQDGLCYNQFKLNSGLMTADHTLFLGSVFGLTGFNPRKLVNNRTRPQITITDLYLFNKPVDVADENSPLKTAISYADEIDLHQSHNNLTFKFASSCYSQTEKNVYEYKLTPFEESWQRTADGNNAAYYTNLPAGEYTLHVRTSNSAHIWSEEKCLKVHIRPYWWASVPMKVLYVLLLFSLIALAFLRYMRKKRKEIYLLRLEKEQEVYHSKMEFFTFMIHEIRTPLTLILGPLTDIMEQKGSIEDTLPQLTTIKRNANRLLALVNQLMDFRKVEEKSYAVQIRKTDLKQLVTQIAQNFNYNCTQQHITLVQDLPQQECWAMADPEALNKIISNLLSNATKFTADRIEIGLRLSPTDNTWKISIKDNGKGIGPAEHTKIFNSFYQVRQDLPSDYIGTGVGLSVVKHLLELQGGSIDVESQIGEGACFIATVPAAAVAPVEQEEILTEDMEENGIAPHEASEKYRLLIAEDNDEMRQYIKSIFEPQYEVDACANGQEALDMTQHQGYDLILTDWMMPVMDGITLAKTLKNQNQTCHIPIVILTAKDDESSQIEGFTTHADAYVVKPFSAKVLLSQVEAIIKNREALRKDYLEEPETSNEVLWQNDLDKEFFEKLDALIDERIMNTTISIDELASNLFMGRTSFYQKMKGVAGVTPNEYVSTYKLKKAAEIIRKGNVRINEIRYMLGFSSSSYFSKKFTAQFGMSPREYQKSIQKKE